MYDNQADAALRMLRRQRGKNTNLELRTAPVLLLTKLPGWIEDGALQSLNQLEKDIHALGLQRNLEELVSAICD